MERTSLTFLHGNTMLRCTARVDKHFVGYHTLQFMCAGGVELSYDDDRRYTMKGKWFWPAYPGPPIRFHAAAGHAFWVHRYIAFTGPLVARWAADGLLLREPQPAPRARDYRRRFDELIAQALRGDRWGTLRGINLLESILIELAEARAAQRSSAQEWLDRAVNRLSDPHGEPDYEKLAIDCDMGLSTLRRRFRRATGTPMHTFALQCRVAAAREMLGATDLPIKEVARRLGYADVYFFTRQFRQFTRVPPAAYRKSRQA